MPSLATHWVFRQDTTVLQRRVFPISTRGKQAKRLCALALLFLALDKKAAFNISDFESSVPYRTFKISAAFSVEMRLVSILYSRRSKLNSDVFRVVISFTLLGHHHSFTEVGTYRYLDVQCLCSVADAGRAVHRVCLSNPLAYLSKYFQ